MELKALLVTVLALTSGVSADHHTHNQLLKIKSATTDFHTKIGAWDGSYLGAMPILKHSYNLRSVLNTAMSPGSAGLAARAASDPAIEAQAMLTAQSLADEVGIAVDKALEKYLMMKSIPVVGLKLGRKIFQSLSDASVNLGNQFAPRAGPEHAETVEEIMKQIQDHFQRGFEAFEQAEAVTT